MRDLTITIKVHDDVLSYMADQQLDVNEWGRVLVTTLRQVAQDSGMPKELFVSGLRNMLEQLGELS
jgi:hypothetical protein